MAYFPNGTTGEMWEEEYCSRCIHNTEDPEDGLSYNACPVLELHYRFNYAQGGDEEPGATIKKFLSTLIPMKEVHADKCSMFIEAEQTPDAYVEHLQEGKPPIEFSLNQEHN